ncbi:hypothetical protein AB0J80_27390 [Actinoplanes sp. NPDC049548]|uniref:hypothetical protein n=1 Tax=Actinoplanes sp. NPDC049548 TaxID=3155152 RepID=UPI00341853B1
MVVLSAVALTFAMGLAGCGKEKDPSVATANPGAPKAAASAAPQGDDTGLKFSQCMRDQGMSWFPDPGADGGLKVSIPEGTDQNKYDKAEEACKAYAPGSGSQGGRLSDEDLGKIRQMAQCMRDKGFTNYPDPDSNGSIQINEDTVGISPDDPAFQKAMQECQKYMPPRRGGGNS